MQAVQEARTNGLPVCYTIDAGPNVHVITEATETNRVAALLQDLPGVQEIRTAGVGGPAQLFSAG